LTASSSDKAPGEPFGGPGWLLITNAAAPPPDGTPVGVAAGNTAGDSETIGGEDGVLTGWVPCVKYDKLTRFDFNGNVSVKINGRDVPIAADVTMVFVPSLGYSLTIAEARAYCQTFEVYTDPLGYKVRIIIGR
jgi:hypothetical protein